MALFVNKLLALYIHKYTCSATSNVNDAQFFLSSCLSGSHTDVSGFNSVAFIASVPATCLPVLVHKMLLMITWILCLRTYTGNDLTVVI